MFESSEIYGLFFPSFRLTLWVKYQKLVRKNTLRKKLSKNYGKNILVF